MRPSTAKNIGDYISEFEPNYQALLIQMWETISTAAPEATEDIKYAMPTFVLNGNKEAIQFPVNQDIPPSLVTKIVTQKTSS